MDRRVILSKYVVNCGGISDNRHRLITIQIDVVFSNFDVFVHNNPEA